GARATPPPPPSPAPPSGGARACSRRGCRPARSRPTSWNSSYGKTAPSSTATSTGCPPSPTWSTGKSPWASRRARSRSTRTLPACRRCRSRRSPRPPAPSTRPGRPGRTGPPRSPSPTPRRPRSRSCSGRTCGAAPPGARNCPATTSCSPRCGAATTSRCSPASRRRSPSPGTPLTCRAPPLLSACPGGMSPRSTFWHNDSSGRAATPMLPGIDDLRKKTEITCEPDATTMLDFARSNTMNLLSIRAIQRDNGGCPPHRPQQHLFGHRAGHLGPQPPPRAVHRMTSPAAADVPRSWAPWQDSGSRRGRPMAADLLVAVSYPVDDEFVQINTSVLDSSARLAFVHGRPEGEVREVLRRADALLAWHLGEELPAGALTESARLRFVQLLSAGADSVNYAAVPGRL